MSKVHAIPTVYNGIEFRSRLEAKWAAMFDQLGWSWEYEPVDFKGYIPDFYIDFGLEEFFIEIKPAMRSADLYPALNKAVAALGDDRDHTILVLGGSIGGFKQSSLWELIAIMDQPNWHDVDDVYLGGCPTCRRMVPLTRDGGWGFPCCKVREDDGRPQKHYRYELPVDGGRVGHYWATATNIVKYQNVSR